MCDHFVYIPQSGRGTASLNVAIATSIILHHFSLWAGHTEQKREGYKFVVEDRPPAKAASAPSKEEAQKRREERQAQKQARAAQNANSKTAHYEATKKMTEHEYIEHKMATAEEQVSAAATRATATRAVVPAPPTPTPPPHISARRRRRRSMPSWKGRRSGEHDRRARRRQRQRGATARWKTRRT